MRSEKAKIAKWVLLKNAHGSTEINVPDLKLAKKKKFAMMYIEVCKILRLEAKFFV